MIPQDKEHYLSIQDNGRSRYAYTHKSVSKERTNSYYARLAATGMSTRLTQRDA